jgi:hypothetical protein
MVSGQHLAYTAGMLLSDAAPNYPLVGAIGCVNPMG